MRKIRSGSINLTAALNTVYAIFCFPFDAEEKQLRLPSVGK